MMLADLYGKPLAETPDKPAIVFKGRPLTYGQLDDEVQRYADALAAAGVGLGDRVALFMGNRPEFFALEMACFELGSICVPLNFRFQTDGRALPRGRWGRVPFSPPRAAPPPLL